MDCLCFRTSPIHEFRSIRDFLPKFPVEGVMVSEDFYFVISFSSNIFVLCGCVCVYAVIFVICLLRNCLFRMRMHLASMSMAFILLCDFLYGRRRDGDFYTMEGKQSQHSFLPLKLNKTKCPFFSGWNRYFYLIFCLTY